MSANRLRTELNRAEMTTILERNNIKCTHTRRADMIGPLIAVCENGLASPTHQPEVGRPATPAPTSTPKPKAKPVETLFGWGGWREWTPLRNTPPCPSKRHTVEFEHATPNPEDGVTPQRPHPPPMERSPRTTGGRRPLPKRQPRPIPVSTPASVKVTQPHPKPTHPSPTAGSAGSPSGKQKYKPFPAIPVPHSLDRHFTTGPAYILPQTLAQFIAGDQCTSATTLAMADLKSGIWKIPAKVTHIDQADAGAVFTVMISADFLTHPAPRQFIVESPARMDLDTPEHILPASAVDNAPAFAAGNWAVVPFVVDAPPAVPRPTAVHGPARLLVQYEACIIAGPTLPAPQSYPHSPVGRAAVVWPSLTDQGWTIPDDQDVIPTSPWDFIEVAEGRGRVYQLVGRRGRTKSTPGAAEFARQQNSIIHRLGGRTINATRLAGILAHPCSVFFEDPEDVTWVDPTRPPVCLGRVDPAGDPIKACRDTLERVVQVADMGTFERHSAEVLLGWVGIVEKFYST